LLRVTSFAGTGHYGFTHVLLLVFILTYVPALRFAEVIRRKKN